MLKSESSGCQVMCRDNNTVLVFNCSVFCQTHIDALTALHPRITYEVRACEASTSGFVVVITHDTRSDILRTSDFFTIMVSCLVAAVSVFLVV